MESSSSGTKRKRTDGVGISDDVRRQGTDLLRRSLGCELECDVAAKSTELRNMASRVEGASKSAGRELELLQALQPVAMTRELLKQTGIGRLLNTPLQATPAARGARARSGFVDEVAHLGERVSWAALEANHVIVCAGPERSGSTWLYNAVRLLRCAAKIPCDSYWMPTLTEEGLVERFQGVLTELARHLDLRIGAGCIARVCQELLDLKRKHVGNAVCQVTKLWPNHMSDDTKRMRGTADASNEQLNYLADPEYATVLNSRFKEFQQAYGYVYRSLAHSTRVGNSDLPREVGAGSVQRSSDGS